MTARTRTPEESRRLLLRAISERELQAGIVAEAKLRGWRVYTHWNSLHSPRGWPDMVLIRSPRVLFLELKRELGHPTAAQRECLEALRECGLDARLVRPSDRDAIAEVLR